MNKKPTCKEVKSWINVGGCASSCTAAQKSKAVDAMCERGEKPETCSDGSSWHKDETMYTCETVPPCCSDYEAKGISKDTVQCVEISFGKYEVMCTSAAT